MRLLEDTRVDLGIDDSGDFDLGLSDEPGSESQGAPLADVE
jgi:hypothetical protein